MLKFAVIGDPVAHSRSPAIHRALLASAEINGSYEAIRIESGAGREAVLELRARGYAGLNVTTPLKEEAFALAETLDVVARRSGSVNTLTLVGDRIDGANTDGIGALAALRASGLEPADAAVLVLGVGPTARAACVALRDAGAHVTVWNRTPERADEFVGRYDVRRFEAGLRFDAALSTLPPDATLAVAVLEALEATAIVVDANYGERATLGRRLRRAVPDGSIMLEAQARASFDIWRARCMP